MQPQALSIRPFIGSKDFAQSRAFYTDLGFEETTLFPNMSLYRMGTVSFYLQDYYNEDWVNNTMVFVEVADAQQYWRELQALHLPAKYAGVKVSPMQTFDWGKECYVHDPAGILWHFGEFAQ